MNMWELTKIDVPSQQNAAETHWAGCETYNHNHIHLPCIRIPLCWRTNYQITLHKAPTMGPAVHFLLVITVWSTGVGGEVMLVTVALEVKNVSRVQKNRIVV